jgi:DNA-binding response OmpR family regulator
MTSNGLYKDYNCTVDFAHRSVRLNEASMQLTRKEFDLLAKLVGEHGRIVSRDVLLQEIWGYGPQIRTRTLDVHIRRLRRKLGAYGEMHIETVFGIGYRFQPREEYLDRLAATA